MSDKDKAEVPGQGVGTPPAPTSSVTQSGSPAKPAQEPASQEGTEAKPVTAQDLVELEERLKANIQSQVDKSSARVQKRLVEIDQAVAVMKAGGQEITDESVKAMKQKAAAEALIEQPQETIATVDEFNTAQWNQADPAVQVVLQAQANAKMTINSSDPEAKMINRANAAVWIQSNLAALEAKAKRLATSGEELTTTTPPAARIPPGGKTPGEAPAGSASEYWRTAYPK